MKGPLGRQAAVLGALLGVGMAVSLVDCGTSSERERILEERARWNVTLGSWALNANGKVVATLTVSGPVYSELDKLTVRVTFTDANGRPIDERWVPLDVSHIQRGTPEDMTVVIAPPAVPPEGMSVTVVTDLTPAQEKHVVELSTGEHS